MIHHSIQRRGGGSPRVPGYNAPDPRRSYPPPLPAIQPSLFPTIWSAEAEWIELAGGQLLSVQYRHWRTQRHGQQYKQYCQYLQIKAIYFMCFLREHVKKNLYFIAAEGSIPPPSPLCDEHVRLECKLFDVFPYSLGMLLSPTSL